MKERKMKSIIFSRIFQFLNLMIFYFYCYVIHDLGSKAWKPYMATITIYIFHLEMNDIFIFLLFNTKSLYVKDERPKMVIMKSYKPF